MNNAFLDMDMEVSMEETPFDVGGLPAGNSEKEESTFPNRLADNNVSDDAWEDTEENSGPETDGTEGTGEPQETGEPEGEGDKHPDMEKESEDKKRAEHEIAEARRKAEWEARQQAKKDAEQAQLARLSSLSDEEVAAEALKRVGADTEKLTRRNMKECVSEYIQTLCLETPDFARLAMHPRKTMIHCFRYINRKAREFIEQEMKDNDIKPENGVYGSDVPDDLCYQWAEEYFRDPNAEEDQEKEDKFIPRAYSGKSSVKPKKAKTVGKKTPVEKNTKKAEKAAGNDQFEQMTLAGLAG